MSEYLLQCKYTINFGDFDISAEGSNKFKIMQILSEFPKLLALRTQMPYAPTCLLPCVFQCLNCFDLCIYGSTCLCGFVIYGPMCLRAFAFYESTCLRACEGYILRV